MHRGRPRFVTVEVNPIEQKEPHRGGGDAFAAPARSGDVRLAVDEAVRGVTAWHNIFELICFQTCLPPEQTHSWSHADASGAAEKQRTDMNKKNKTKIAPKTSAKSKPSTRASTEKLGKRVAEKKRAATDTTAMTRATPIGGSRDSGDMTVIAADTAAPTTTPSDAMGTPPVPASGAVGHVATPAANPARVEPKSAKPATPRRSDPRIPPPGTIIEKRDRNGVVRCSCEVTKDGIVYAGKTFGSLSSAAVAAARDLGLGGKSQNGFVFWGVIPVARKARDPMASITRAWERYRGQLDAVVKSTNDENRAATSELLGQHAHAIEAARASVG